MCQQLFGVLSPILCCAVREKPSYGWSHSFAGRARAASYRYTARGIDGYMVVAAVAGRQAHMATSLISSVGGARLGCSFFFPNADQDVGQMCVQQVK